MHKRLIGWVGPVGCSLRCSRADAGEGAGEGGGRGQRLGSMPEDVPVFPLARESAWQGARGLIVQMRKTPRYVWFPNPRFNEQLVSLALVVMCVGLLRR